MMIRRGSILAILMWGVLAGVLEARVPELGRQAPAMPRIWDQGVDSWINIGAGPLGAEISFSRQFEKTVATAHLGYLLNGDLIKGGQLGVTLGLPLSKNEFLAVVGAGAGLHIGVFGGESRAMTRACLLGNLQLFLAVGQGFGIGVHSTLGVSGRGVAGTVCLGIQYGRKNI